MIGEVRFADGRNLSQELVKAGLAWHDEQYAPHDTVLQQLQAEAQAAKRGLWSDPRPTPPWEWRKHEWDRRKEVPPSEIRSSPAIQAQPQAAPRKWVCDRKEVAGQNHAAIDCGWR